MCYNCSFSSGRITQSVSTIEVYKQQGTSLALACSRFSKFIAGNADQKLDDHECCCCILIPPTSQLSCLDKIRSVHLVQTTQRRFFATLFVPTNSDPQSSHETVWPSLSIPTLHLLNNFSFPFLCRWFQI